jgi:hypothetical protein
MNLNYCIITFTGLLFFVLPELKSEINLSKKQDTLKVVLYETSMDFRQKKSMGFEAVVITKDKADYYFFADKVINLSSDKKVRDAGLIWAMEYNGHMYINAAYSDEMFLPGMFLKFDVAGNYCAVKLDDKIGDELIISESYKRTLFWIGVGFGITGAFIYQLLNRHRKDPEKYVWKDFKKQESLIVICNTMEESYRNFSWSRNESCLLQFLSKEDLNTIIKKNPSIGLKDDPVIEEIFTYFKVLNDCH